MLTYIGGSVTTDQYVQLANKIIENYRPLAWGRLGFVKFVQLRIGGGLPARQSPAYFTD